MTHALLLSVATLGAFAAPALAGRQPAGDELVKPRLVAEHSGLVAGAENWIAVHFEIEPTWHLYWKGQNDSGAPPEIKLLLPEGYTAGEVLWPAPKRHVVGDEILDHVYEEQVTLLIPVRVPASAPGSTAKLAADLRWMVCQDMCLLGSGSISLSLPVQQAMPEPRRSADARLFDTARARLPKPVPKPTDGQQPPFTIAWEGGAAVVTAPGAQHIAFYPSAQAAGFESFLRDAAAKGERLTLKVNPVTDGAVRLDGVLEITRAKPAPPSIFALRAEPQRGETRGNQGGG